MNDKGVSVIRFPITIGTRWESIPTGKNATVMDDEFSRVVLQPLRWHADEYGYPRTNFPGRRTPIRLHRLVYEQYYGVVPAGMVVDHIDRDPLNALPSNLRCVPQSVNCANRDKSKKNTSGYIRVHWSNLRSKWIAQCPIRGTRRSRHLGVFDDPVQAAKAVNAAYREVFPEVTIPNPEVEEQL